MKTAKEIAVEYYDLIANNYDSIPDLEETLQDFAKMHAKAAYEAGRMYQMPGQSAQGPQLTLEEFLKTIK